MSPLPIGYQASASPAGLFVDHDVNNVIDATEYCELPTTEMGRLLVQNTRFDSVPLDPQDHSLKLSMQSAAKVVGSLPDTQLVDLLASDPFAGLPQGDAQRVEFASALRAEIGDERFDQALFQLDRTSPVRSQAGPVWKHALDEAKSLATAHPLDSTTVPQLDETSKLSVGQAFGQAIADNQVVMIGKMHTRWDEAVFEPMLAQAKAQGVKYVALEFPSNLQGALDTYVRTGRNEFPLTGQDIGRRGLPNLAFARAAHKAGLEVVAIDMPESQLTNRLANENLLQPYMAWKANASYIDASALRGVQLRDEYLSSRLGTLAEKGKTIALMGKGHTFLDSQPAPTARTLLHQRGVTTASFFLESRDARSGAVPVTDQAYVNVFGNSAPRESFAYPAGLLHGLGHADPTHEMLRDAHSPPLIPYERTPQDYVVFLSDEFQRRNDAFHR